ncbi:MAG TPA: SBBP repeat-containing protein [Acidobacteriota bacterium]|jgi:hypothetical protein
MSLRKANRKVQITGVEELPGQVNYFIGKDPATWRTNIPAYSSVKYANVYPGVDLVYYGNQRQLEYDFVVRPGGDPTKIVLRFQGTEKLEVDGRGDLILHTGSGAIRQRKPVVYQNADGARREISGDYVLKNAHSVGIHVGAFDASKTLVIDPVLFYSTYLGGSGSDDGTGIAVDAAGNAYITGETTSTNFPIVAGAPQTSFSGVFDVFVTKLNPTGSGLVYSTYFGGSGDDAGLRIAVDALDNAYISGLTTSTNFPVTSSAFQASYAGGEDAFVAKLNSSGSVLLYSTYLGGSGLELGGEGLAVDASGNAYVVGLTQSSNFPVTSGSFQTTFPGGQSGFVTKLNPASSGAASLVYSTYLGGSSGGDRAESVAVDTFGNAHVVGSTLSSDFPTTAGAFQTVYKGGNGDDYLTKFNAAGSGLLYSTYLGGTNNEGLPARIALDVMGNAYITGVTNSSDFPIVNAFQGSIGGGYDVFAAKVNPFAVGASSLVYCTFLGGSADDFGYGIAIDGSSNAYVTGPTQSTNFPTTSGAFQPAFGGGSYDAFVAKINPLGNWLVYSSYLGGVSDDIGRDITVDAFANAYVTGDTASTTFPTTSGGFQTTFGGGLNDAFVAKITDIGLPPPPTVGKVTGGGSINVANGIGTFGFIVQRQASDGSINGDVQYVDHANSAKVHSVIFTSFAIAGNTVTFGGTCTNNGAPVTDNGEPGTGDSFTISVSGGPTEGGTLRSGNIQIHQ